jgi:serine/threonine protein kinase
MDLRLAAPVAVKLIDPEIAKDAGAKERFMREAHAAAALRSPHVVQIIDYAVEDDLPFIVMELLEGENLAQRLKRAGKLSPLETARLLSHVARAVGKAHEVGIVHRDLKPENVFIVHNEDEEVAKVLDFGVAKVESGGFVASGARTRTGSLLGTPYYMSPEQVQGNKEVDHRSDLWALGVIAFEALTGRKPFQSDLRETASGSLRDRPGAAHVRPVVRQGDGTGTERALPVGAGARHHAARGARGR